MSSMRVAVVTNRWGSSWDEEHVVTRRLAGALACFAEVDLCVAEGPVAREFRDGAVRVLQFPAVPVDTRRTEALRRALLGPTEEDGLAACSCTGGVARERARNLPRSVQEELVYGAGGHSPALFSHLEDDGYDVVLFVGYRSAATYLGMRAVPDRCRVVLWPAATEDPLLHLPVHDETFARADAILACTRTEEELVNRRLNGSGPAKTSMISFVLRINALAVQTAPHGFEDHQYLIVAHDWTRGGLDGRLDTWGQALQRDFEDADLAVRLVGPGSNYLAPVGGVSLASSRTDVWRWMSRALAVIDPLPHRLLGREVIEAMLCGTPVLVSDQGGATREHAERGNGGLWFKTYEEFTCLVEGLLDRSLREVLGSQAQAYAVREFGDSDIYVERVANAVLA